MRRYLLNRLWQSVVTLVLATIVVFAGVRALPGDPALALAGEDRDPESLRAIRQQYGLDKSELVQFWQFVSHAVRGDLGQSMRTGEPVRPMFVCAVPPPYACAVLPPYWWRV